MAITYKSQGSGVATETSAAALSPQCPATVDAGDILIAHVFWEGTTTAPSTPGTWTLLRGPDVIETTIARHWVFGKIADGTEDGAAVAFGNPAVTTQRAARIYSFAGRVGGTITELVTGFAHTSNANDPTFPNVTTTINGALAVALVAQNDNNTLASPTGETGGDWTEAVAEFSANLTPGLSLGICTATPTGNPGTITGGTDNTTNDPVGVVGFQIKQSNNINIDAGVGALTLTGFAPTVAATQNRNLTPDVGLLTLTGFAPTVFATNSKNVTPDFGVLTFTGFAPTVSVSDNKNILADIGSITFSGFAPTVAATANRNITPDTGVLTLTGFNPVVVVSDNKNVLPGTGVITFTGFAPTIETPVNVQANTGQIIFTGFAPSVTTGDNREVQAGTGELTFNGFEPTIQTPRNIQTDSGVITFTGFSPTVQTPKNILTGFGEIVFEGFAPTVSIGGGEVLVEADFGELVFEGFEPSVVIGLRLKSYVTTQVSKESPVTTIYRVNSFVTNEIREES